MGLSQNNILPFSNMNFNLYTTANMTHHIRRSPKFNSVQLIENSKQVRMVLPAMELRWAPSAPMNAGGKWDVELKITNALLPVMLREIDVLNKALMVRESTWFLKLTKAQAESATGVDHCYKSMVLTEKVENPAEPYGDELTLERIKVKVNTKSTKVMVILVNNDDVTKRVTAPATVADIARDDVVQVEVSFMLYNTANISGSQNCIYGCTMNVERLWVLPRHRLTDEEAIIADSDRERAKQATVANLGPMVRATGLASRADALEEIEITK